MISDRISKVVLIACGVGTIAGLLLTSADRKAQSRAQGPASVEDKLKQLDKSILARDFSFRRDVHATSLFRAIPVLAHDIYARFPGKVVYRRERNGVEAAARELYAAVKNGANGSGRVAVGLDCEWKPTWGKALLISALSYPRPLTVLPSNPPPPPSPPPGPENPCALLQLCANADVCYLFHLKFTGIPETLRALLKDASVVKTGVGVTEDGRKLRKDFGVEVNGLVDCSPLAAEKAVVKDGGQMVGLKTLTRLVLQKELAKPKRVQCSNWEGFPLTDAQLIYASTDAFVSLRIFQELDAMPSPWQGGINGHEGGKEEDDTKGRKEKRNKEKVGKQEGKEGEEKKGKEEKKSKNGKEGQADVEAKTGKKSKRKQDALEEGKRAATADGGVSEAAEADGARKKRRKQASTGEGKADGGSSSGSKVASLKEAAADTASRWICCKEATGPVAAVVKSADQVMATQSHARDFSFRRDVQATSLFYSIPLLAQDIYARFPGKVVYRREHNGVEAAAKELYAAVKNGANGSGRAAVGLDCEWKPKCWKGGPENPCALLQLCASADVCYLFHLKFSGVPETLRALLKDASVIKTGVGVTADGWKLSEDFDVELNGLVDCSPLALEKAVVPGGGQKAGLKALTRLVLQKEVSCAADGRRKEAERRRFAVFLGGRNALYRFLNGDLQISFVLRVPGLTLQPVAASFRRLKRRPLSGLRGAHCSQWQHLLGA
ncbi:unnamed protein product [Closterium sp. Yama58-4]|nr:unnamed protein product [Closterium sp. Yama58-4]